MKTFERANSTKSSTATGCGVLPADTVARSLTGNPAFARFATTGAGHSMCPGAMSAAFNATPSRKNPSSMLIQGHWLTASARSEEHTSELQSRLHLVCRLLLEKKKKT